MRTYTILVSILAHALGVIVFITTTLGADSTLPEPRRATEFVVVTPERPSVPPPVPRRRTDAVPPVSTNAAPTEAPDRVTPEAVHEPLLDALPGVTGSLVSGDAFGRPMQDAGPPAPPPSPIGPVRVGGVIRQPRRTHDVAPVYPPIALSTHISGVVILEAVIGEDGAVRDVHVLRSIPLLDQAAVDAVRQWTFTPTLLNGQPVPVVMTVTVTFNAR